MENQQQQSAIARYTKSIDHSSIGPPFIVLILKPNLPRSAKQEVMKEMQSKFPQSQPSCIGDEIFTFVRGAAAIAEVVAEISFDYATRHERIAAAHIFGPRESARKFG